MKSVLRILVALMVCLASSTFFPHDLYAEDSVSALVSCNFDVAKEGKITKLEMTKKEFGGKQTVHILIALQNVSDTPVRFEMFVETEQGIAGSSLIPFKGKPPKVLKPNAVFEAEFPTWLTAIPKTLKIDVKTTDFLE